MRRSSICLFSDIYDLKKSGVALDTRLILDDGELAIHWPLLQIWGDHWWTGLGQAGDDNVVLLPGVSVTDAQVFVDGLYSRDIVNNRHFTVTEDTGVVNEEICSDKSDDIKLEPYEIYDQVACETCGKLFYNQKSLSDHIYDTHKVKAVFKYLVWQRKVSF